MPRSGCASPSRATSSTSVVSRLGRRAAERPLQRPAQVAQRRPAARRSRARAPRAAAGCRYDTTSSTPNRRWITPSCTSRARSIRSCSWRARAAGTSRGAPPRPAPTSCRASTAGRAPPRSAAGAAAGRRGSRRSSARPPTAGTQTSVASSSRSRKPSGTSRATVSASISITRSSTQRLARDRRRLDGHARVREALEVEPEGARGAHPAVRLVVAEDHRAVHRGQPADRLAERRVEAVGGAVGLDARQQLDERLERVDAHDRRTLLARRRLRSVATRTSSTTGGRAVSAGGTRPRPAR